ncbi:MAG: DMT family transporter [Mesorhizobium sp.]|uniref:EamA family transporter n=1 Tax=Mesorhizobium sp. TaxID=1871066 RepID=UPI000FEA5767|nr:DMT family transporter [Mesorhizobium sp.]RWE13839.1 MAG: DMT family transporter [Mesorhizobium sp.]RWE83669.1 MAG: DMT family transporter [Mesorhizobium sp.]
MDDPAQPPAAIPALAGPVFGKLATSLPPHVWFGVSAVFHYLGPAFAVLLFPHVGVLGMAWLRIVTAALVFAPLTRPWTVFAGADRPTRLLLLAFGACLGVMNCSFYLALDRLPISLVAAIEFVGTIGVALVGVRSPRNLAALVIAVIGTLLLIDVKWSSDLIGLLWAFLNGALFVGYIVLGHRVARAGAGDGFAGLGAAMAVAFLIVLPVGFTDPLPAFSAPPLLIGAIGVGICSSVIPYICDQLAMSRLPRSSFALMLSLLPVTATLIGVIVLRQIPGPIDCIGIALVMAGVAFHKPANA